MTTGKTMGDIMKERFLPFSLRKGQKAIGRAFSTGSLAAALLLAACGDLNPPSEAAGDMVAENADAMVIAAPQIVDALCARQAQDVVDFLSSEPLASPIDKMYLALALETTGQSDQALVLFDELGAANSIDPILIRCEGNISIMGQVSEVARFRAKRRRMLDETLDVYSQILAAARQQLALAGEAPRGADGSKRMLDDATKADKKPAAKKKSTPPNAPKGPIQLSNSSMASSSGLFFAHFHSYRDRTKIASGIQSLERTYPTLRGQFSDWQVTAGGRALWRVGVRTIDFNDAERLCAEVTQAGQYCRVLDTTQ